MLFDGDIIGEHTAVARDNAHDPHSLEHPSP